MKNIPFDKTRTYHILQNFRNMPEKKIPSQTEKLQLVDRSHYETQSAIKCRKLWGNCKLTAKMPFCGNFTAVCL